MSVSAASPSSPLINLFRFLSAFAASRQPLARRLEQYPLSQGYRFWRDLPDNDYLQVAIADAERDFLLDLTLPPQQACPAPSALIVDWLAPGWHDWRRAEVTVLTEKILTTADGRTLTETFAEQPQRQADYQQWRSERDNWRQWQLQHQPVRELFAWLQGLYSELQKQGGALELALGCAILQDRQQRYKHPLLIKPVQLHFNVANNHFRLEDSERHTELYLPLLSELTEHAGLVAPIWLEQSQHLHPLDENARLHSQIMRDWLSNQPECRDMDIDDQLVLYVRTRGGWNSQVADDIIKRLASGAAAAAPLYLQRLAGLVSGHEQLALASTGPSTEQILFALPANPEQHQLAQQLEQHDIVLVQGPPGTGKTHTIANLIGHLLAQNKRILITSHSSKALRVLREKVPSTIRSLCVSVLDDDKQSKRELAEAVIALSEHMANADALAQAAEQSRRQRARLLDREKQLQEQQRLCLEQEYRMIVVAGQQTPPSEAARFVHSGRGLHDWLPPFADHERGKACPLHDTELHWLYASQQLLPVNAEQELAAGLPKLADLPTPEAWRQTLTMLAHYQQSAHDRQHWLWPQLSAVHISRLTQSLEQAQALQQQIDSVCRHGDWLHHILESGLDNQQNLLIWNELFSIIEESHQQLLQVQSLLVEYDPRLPEELLSDERTPVVLAEIRAYLQAGGSFSWWKMLVNPAWKKVLESAHCNDQTVSQLVHVEALQACVAVKRQQQRLQRRWQRQIVAIGGAALPETNTSRAAMDWLLPLQNALLWGQQLWPAFVEQHIAPLGMDWRQLEQVIVPQSQHATPRLQRLKLLLQQEIIPEWQAHLARSCAEQLTLTIDQSRQRLQPFMAQRRPNSVIHALLDALERKDAADYDSAYQTLQDLLALADDYRQRQHLLQQLATGASQWSQAIRLRQPPHHRPLAADCDLASAWRWRQLHDELQYRQQLDPERINSQLQQTSQDLQRVTGELISQQTWAHQASAAEPYRQHLVGWQQTQTKIGKGTGKQTAHLRRVAQDQLRLAQYAVPVWIMPLAEVFRSFQIDSVFDVVIVDEASQVDITGLLATYLGKKVVIVGDDEQVSPDAVGADSEVARRLQQEYLQQIPNAHLYDGQTSLYDLTKQVARGQLCLREHFRCVPAIIGFSNQLSYQGRIKPLREPASSALTAHIVPYRVQGQRQPGKINPEEAHTIVALVQAMCQHPAYHGKTLGVISLLGNEQATLIETELRKVLPMSLIAERRLLCGNSAQFQGDERDVILLSMVDSNEGDGVMRLQGDGARDMSKKRYNVAASRARDQLWIIHSLDYQNQLQAQDLRRQLLAYADQHTSRQSSSNNDHLTESPFEEAVLKQLLARGYRVQTQYTVGYYRIDLVVIGAHSRLAVECDGDKYHSGSEKISEDLARQAILERLGWQFHRIRGSAFFSQPEQALQSLWQRLAELGIEPESSGRASATLTQDLLHQDIIRLATNLRTQTETDSADPADAAMPAPESLPDHDSITAMFRQRSEQRRKGLI